MLIQDLPSLKKTQLPTLNKKDIDAFKNIEIKKTQNGPVKFLNQKDQKHIVDFEQMLQENKKEILEGNPQEKLLKSKITEQPIEKKEFFPKKELKNTLKNSSLPEEEAKVSHLAFPEKVSPSTDILKKPILPDAENIIVENQNPVFKVASQPLQEMRLGDKKENKVGHFEVEGKRSLPFQEVKEGVRHNISDKMDIKNNPLSFLDDGIKNRGGIVQEQKNPLVQESKEHTKASLFKKVFSTDFKELDPSPRKMTALKDELVFIKRELQDEKLPSLKLGLHQYEEVLQHRSQGPYQKMVTSPFVSQAPVFESHVALAVPVLVAQKEELSFENFENFENNATPFSSLPSVSSHTPSAEVPVFKLKSIENVPATQVMDQIKGYISQLNVSNKGEVALAFDHHDLGKVVVSITKDEGNKVSLSIETNSDKAASFFTEHKGDLSLVLKSGGNELSEFKVTQHSSESLSLSPSSSSISLPQQFLSAEGFMNRFDDTKQNTPFNDRSNQGHSERQKDQHNFQGHGQSSGGGQQGGERDRRYAQYTHAGSLFK